MKERIAFVDYIRVIACLLVMVVHASEQFYNMGPISQLVNEDNRLWVSVYDGFLGRISVPLFMIVSAFLLVPMKTGMTMSQFYHRRFLRSTLQLPAMGRTSVVHVSAYQPLSHHPRGVALARKVQCEGRTDVPRHLCLLYTHPLVAPLRFTRTLG